MGIWLLRRNIKEYSLKLMVPYRMMHGVISVIILKNILFKVIRFVRFSILQIKMFVSKPPDTIYLPLGDQAKLFTRALWNTHPDIFNCNKMCKCDCHFFHQKFQCPRSNVFVEWLCEIPKWHMLAPWSLPQVPAQSIRGRYGQNRQLQ